MPGSFDPLCTNSMNYSFKFSNLVKPNGRAFYLLFAPPGRSRRCPFLIPAGDPYSSRGQRPRNARPQGSATLKGSHSGSLMPIMGPPAQRDATPSGSGVEGHAFRGRCPRLLSCALAGREELCRRMAQRPVHTILMLAFRPEFLPIRGSRRVINAQNDSIEAFFRSL